ncbi:MAG: hypothetical protein PHX83_00205 [Acidobacteriia bacterium]|nr:hypothetical protein [Terriglobia bacterium]
MNRFLLNFEKSLCYDAALLWAAGPAHAVAPLMKLRLILFLVVSAILWPAGLAAQQRPLLTQDVDLIQPGHILFEFGIDFLQSDHFPLSGLRGDLTSVGVIGINIGLGETAEFQLEGTTYNFLAVSGRSPSFVTPHLSADGLSTSGFGDFTLATKLRILPEGKHRPSFGFRFGFQMPNSNQSNGIGLNTTNVFGTILIGKHFGKLNTFSNVGIGILTAPTLLFTQNDVLTYGVAGTYPLFKHITLAGEINGRRSTRGGVAPLGTESLSQARFGVQVLAAGFRWDLAAIKGLTRLDPSSGITLGVTKDIKAFDVPTAGPSK